MRSPLIAASIVLVALNNLRTDSLTNRGAKAWRHLGLVFTCGLIHGLGFATALAALGGVSSQRWPGLLGFNLGVELGQLAIVAVALPLAWWLRGTLFYRRGVLAGCSLAIAAVAGLWFVERAFDVSLIT